MSIDGGDAFARRLIACAFSVSVAVAPVVPAAAQTWPTRPVRIIVPYTPGGGIDTVARVLAQKLTEQIGGSVVVENRPGAGGIVGAELVARAAPDGHALLASGNEFGINPAVRKLPYDPFKDFTPISQLATVQFIVASRPSVPARNMKEAIALAKARPGRLTYGSSGAGGGPHFAGELLQWMAGIRMAHVPFKGAAPATVAVIGGEIDLVFAATIGLLDHVRTGRLRALALTGSKRFAELPQVATVAESGVPGYSAMAWYGFYAPGGTPPELVRRIHSESSRALTAPDVKDKLARSGTEFVMSAPEEFVGFLRAEIAKWAKLVTEANIRIE